MPNQQSQVKNEFQLLDEIDKELSKALDGYRIDKMSMHIKDAKYFVNQLKSLLIQKSRKV